ncbi:hypothetical protein CFN78_13915 [Amycolatopsis antarctica]|uniref:PE-PGRS family protein n=1 Tax=Amycolatopsis antarctica TaxID=1854586 RepID=A0A263D539_9PSEU|nr:hypothetical protein [Amycolatopsis antarctica]OZM72717.1 hypothetical protein CFN78_13915 [Amycolatopsis antarctica]
MQTWAKRGIQTALVTGGLLMLGTGIASADENVNPDTPAGPLDLNVTIPIDIDDNAIGTPLGQMNLPGYHGEISTKPLTEPLHKATAPVMEQLKPVTDAAAPVTKPVHEAAGMVTDAASEAGQRLSELQQQDESASPVPFTAPEHAKAEAPEDAAEGNRVDLDIVAPVQIVGNALALGGDAQVHTDETQTYQNDDDVNTSGSESGASGNAVVLDWAAPVQIAGNAIGGLGGEAISTGSATQNTTQTGDITTDGTQSSLAGNVVAGQAATPVQVTGNAISGLAGSALSEFDASTDAEAGGAILTDGSDQFGSGNVGALPAALPIKANGNAIPALLSNASSASNSEANATAGGTTPGINDIDSYIQTGGENGSVSGNVVQPQGAGVAGITGNAATVLGNAFSGNGLTRQAGSEGTTSSEVVAGGFSSTSGADGALAGNIADVPLALPGELFASAASVAGNADASMISDTSATAGDGTFTNGNDSLLSGNTASSPLAGAVEAYGNAATLVGNAAADGSETKEVSAGGYNGTLGNDSAGSGNLITTPVALPAELFGTATGGLGNAQASGSEIKDVSAGGGGNTDDDFGKISSNLIAAPVSLPAQIFGIGTSAVGNADAAGSTETTSTAGGDYNATGPLGTIAGNLVQAPISLPAQLHGIAAAGGGNAQGLSENLTDSSAGGDATTDGTEGTITGNIVQAPVGGAGSLFGLAGSVLGGAEGFGVNDVTSAAGGDSETAGTEGSLAGNVISAQALPIAQVFGSALDVAGNSLGDGVNTTEVTSGGDIDTDGTEGSISGSILDVPAAAVVQGFGDAVSVLGNSDAFGDNLTNGTVGGETNTAGEQDSLSGLDEQLPIGVLAQVYDVPVEILGNAITEAVNATDIEVAGEEPSFIQQIDGSELRAGTLPSLPGGRMPTTLRADATPISAIDTPQASILPFELPGKTVLGGDDLLGGAFSGKLPLDVPSFDSLDLPGGITSGKLPIDLPVSGQLPTLPGTDHVGGPSVDQLPLVPMDFGRPSGGPAMAQVDSSPLSIFDKLVGELTGKKFHIQ